MIQDLARLPMFRGVATAELRRLLDHLEAARFSTGDRVFEQGDEADGALIVIKGKLEARIAKGGTERRVGAIHPGEICGETGFFQRQGRRNARVVAVQETTCLLLRSESMQATLHNPAMVAIEKHLVSSMARRLRTTNMGIQKIWKEQAAREVAQDPPVESKRSLLGQLRGLWGGGQ